MAFHTSVDEYRHKLTAHYQEEARHAWLWGEAIRKLGHEPLRILRTYQGEYGKRYGMPGSMLEVFCLTQVFERRTVSHFTHHLSLPGVHDEVRETLRMMIDDEEGHLDWIAEELEAYSRRHGEGRVREVMGRIEAVDAEVYDRLLESEPFRSYFGSMDGSATSGPDRMPERTI